MKPQNEVVSALSLLAQEQSVFARLAAKLAELQDEEQQIRVKIRHQDHAERSTGEILEVEALLAGGGPLITPRAGLIVRLREVAGLQPQVKEALRKQGELVSVLQRDASREVVMGAEGDQWRKAVKNLAKLVKELPAAASAVREASRSLEKVLPDPSALMQVSFPPGPVFNFEQSDLARVCESFEARLVETDRYYTP